MKVVEILKNGGVVALPTETVFGLAASLESEKAIHKVYQLKGREFTKPLSIFVSSLEMLEQYVEEVPQVALELIKVHWPGPLTLVFKANEKVPLSILAGGSTVGVRMSSSSLIQKIVEGLGLPITATSANKSGFPSAKSPEEVRQYFGNEIDYILEKDIERGSIESTVIDVSQNSLHVLRKGPVNVKVQST